MKNIHLIDGFDFVRASLRACIGAANTDMQVSAEADNLTKAIENLKSHNADAIVLDISVSKINGMEVFVDIKQASPDIPILIINGSEQADYAANFMRHGCSGYVSSHCKKEDVIEGIHAVTSGQKYIQPAHLYKKIKNILTNTKMLNELSRRELQVFLKQANGKSILTVAKELNISSSTVSVFRSKIFKKLHLKNNAELIMYALNHHYLTRAWV